MRVLAYKIDAIDQSADLLLKMKETGTLDDPHIKHILMASKDKKSLIYYLKALMAPVTDNHSIPKIGSIEELLPRLESK